MRATRRRERKPDPLASPSAIRALCEQLRQRLPDLIPASEKQLVRFLYAVRHVERRPGTDTLRGRPGRWPREKLMEAASQLRSLLQRETGGRISVNSFIGQYLPVLRFPSDVTEALSSGQINLHEAAQLARLTPKRLNRSPQTARAQRMEVLKQHSAVRGSQTRLRARVKELLGETKEIEVSSENMASVMAKADNLLEIDPSDTRHLFWEEMKRLFYAIREIELEDLDGATLDEFLDAMDSLSNLLYRLEKRRIERRNQQTIKHQS